MKEWTISVEVRANAYINVTAETEEDALFYAKKDADSTEWTFLAPFDFDEEDAEIRCDGECP